MTDHFLETPEYEQSENLGLVNLKGAESVKRMISKYKFRWLVGHFTIATPPFSKILDLPLTFPS